MQSYRSDVYDNAIPIPYVFVRMPLVKLSTGCVENFQPDAEQFMNMIDFVSLQCNCGFAAPTIWSVIPKVDIKQGSS